MEIKSKITGWCKGSTRVFETLNLGSIPSPVAMQYIYLIPIVSWLMLAVYFYGGKKTRYLVSLIMLAYMVSFLGAVMLLMVTGSRGII